MKSSLIVLTLASVLTVGCAGMSPVAPDAASGLSLKSNAPATAGAATARPFFPPINPAGISCPSDAPQIAVSSFGMRMDFDFSEVAGAHAYEFEILDYFGAITRLVVDAPANHAEWYGGTLDNAYRVKVRTINCGGVGNWSESVYHALQDNRPEPPPPPPPPPPTEEPEPQCMIGCF
jgi:hypothetical protein